MKVLIEPVFRGSFRISFCVSKRHCVEFVTRTAGENWTRKHSTNALNLLQNLYHVNRKNVRFIG